MKVRFYLARPTSKIETAVYARISYDGMRIGKYYPAESILPKNWNSKTQRARENASFREYPEFNARLDSFAATVKNIYRSYVNDHNNTPPAPDALKELLDARYGRKVVTPEKRMTLLEFFKGFIDRSRSGERTVNRGKRSGKPITEGTVRTYDVTYNCLSGYEKSRDVTLYFEDVTIAFYNDFKSYCVKDLDLSTNYIGKHIKTLKSVMTDAMENFKLHSNRDFESAAFKTIKEDVDGIAVYANELVEFEALNLINDPRLDRVRDWFILGCNMGLRVSDLFGLDVSMIRDGYIEVKQTQKTLEPVHIPLNDTIRHILDKYRWKFPTPFVDQQFNDLLKDLGKLVKCMEVNYTYEYTKGGKTVKDTAPKYTFLSSHAMRRSFCTNEYHAGMPIQLIMAISGHTSEANFYKYIKVKPKDKAVQFKEAREQRELKAKIAQQKKQQTEEK